MRARGPMHDEVNDIRSLITDAVPLASVGRWRTALVPHGVRVTFERPADCQTAMRAMREHGFKLSVLEPTDRRDDALTVVVTGWDGHYLRRLIDDLRARVSVARTEFHPVADEHTQRIEGNRLSTPMLRSTYAADRQRRD